MKVLILTGVTVHETDQKGLAGLEVMGAAIEAAPNTIAGMQKIMSAFRSEVAKITGNGQFGAMLPYDYFDKFDSIMEATWYSETGEYYLFVSDAELDPT